MSFNNPTSSLPLTVRQDFQPRSAGGIYTGARSLLSAFFSILPTHFFLTPKIRKTTNTHNNPQQNTTYVDNTTTSQQSCMYAFHFSTSFFCSSSLSSHPRLRSSSLGRRSSRPRLQSSRRQLNALASQHQEQLL